MSNISYRAANACLTLDSFSRPQAVQATSIHSYQRLAELGTGRRQAGRIYAVLLAAPDGLTNQELAVRTGVRINAVCGRVNELRKEGLVMCGGLRVNPATNVQNMVWIAVRAGGAV